ncbi:DUF4236 domain-containing protein [bacterium]|nr:DUF4236 domain-containing protein [bacterium]
MGFYLRKSLKVGPVRFNLSKSGIGVSAGIKGFRVGTGPRGNYVHMGRGGLYYRKTLSSNHSESRQPQSANVSSPNTTKSIYGQVQTIESASVLQMVDSSASSLLSQLNENRRKINLAPIVGALCGFLFLVMISAGAPAFLLVPTIIFAVIATWASYYNDELNNNTVLFYELEGESELSYEMLHNSFDELARCSGAWHIEAKAAVIDTKRSAGATELVKQHRITIRKTAPPRVKTNIAIPMMPAGKQTLYFCPDRVLVYTQDGIGAVNYTDIYVAVNQINFVLSGFVPSDTRIIGHTWQYVNKDGNPDMRFYPNPQLPIVQYQSFHIKSNSGLNELFYFSRPNAASSLSVVLRQLANANLS